MRNQTRREQGCHRTCPAKTLIPKASADGEKLSRCSDTGEFTLHHYAWNCLKVHWCEVTDLAPQTAFRAVSKQNTLKVAQRILKDAEVGTNRIATTRGGSPQAELRPGEAPHKQNYDK